MRSSRHTLSGFSLVEVIVAVGIFAVAVAAILGLLAGLARQAATSSDVLTGLRLPDAIRIELQRLAVIGGFDALAGRTRPMTTTLPDTLNLTASRDGARIQSLDYQLPVAAGQIAQDEQYYFIEVWSFSQAPLAFDPNGAVLALHVRVSWPYFTPGSTKPAPIGDRAQFACNLSIIR